MLHPPLYILRHGQTVWNAEERFQGRLDSPLTELGCAQAAQQNSILKSRDLTGFSALCSPQGRARRTADIALEGLFCDVPDDSALAEIGMGLWEGKTRSELLPQLEDAEVFDVYERAPQGEGFDALHGRCRQLLARLSGPTVLVTHGITSRMLRVILQGLEIADVAFVDGGQGVVYHLENGVQTKLTIGA